MDMMHKNILSDLSYCISMKHVMKLLMFVFLFTFNLNCLYANEFEKIENKDTLYILTKKYEGIVWNKNYPINVKDNKIYRWNPCIKDIEIAELIMEEYLNKISDSILVNQYGTCPIIHLNLNKYIRQYIGIINEKGDKIIKINCFWNEYINSYPNWKTNLVNVDDGCSFYWSIKVDIYNKVCFDYYINGD